MDPAESPWVRAAFRFVPGGAWSGTVLELDEANGQVLLPRGGWAHMHLEARGAARLRACCTNDAENCVERRYLRSRDRVKIRLCQLLR